MCNSTEEEKVLCRSLGVEIINCVGRCEDKWTLVTTAADVWGNKKKRLWCGYETLPTLSEMSLAKIYGTFSRSMSKISLTLHVSSYLTKYKVFFFYPTCHDSWQADQIQQLFVKLTLFYDKDVCFSGKNLKWYKFCNFTTCNFLPNCCKKLEVFDKMN